MVTSVNGFEDLRIVDNFYQTSSFFPMPIVAISTIAENGQTNLGPYSLIFPYYIAGKDYYSMVLLCRNNSNTARNIMRTKKCALNFIPDDKKYMQQCVKLGFPGDTTEEKMKDCIFTLTEGLMQKENPDKQFPKIIAESFQVFECSWVSELENADRFSIQDEYSPPYNNFNGVTSQYGSHFILKIDRILMKPKYRAAIIDGVKSKGFPKVPVDYGYRDNTNFWISQAKTPYAEPIPKNKGVHLNVVKYAADRMDDKIKFTDEACAKLVKVPRVFLNTALKGCIDWAEKNNVTLITEEHMDIIRNKRASEK
jgi:flavin reductase (DIM6/NTAB) family NADH-FMN oxidoreductase RutF